MFPPFGSVLDTSGHLFPSCFYLISALIAVSMANSGIQRSLPLELLASEKQNIMNGCARWELFVITPSSYDSMEVL